MEDLAERYGPRGVAFAFLYVREAHPGEKVPHHATFEDKCAAARSLRNRFGIRRPLLVDGLDGGLHRAYGTLPNMTYIVDPSGRILYRADWTDAHSIEWALGYLEHEAGERRTTKRVASFYAELRGHRSAADYPRVFVAGLHDGGGRCAVDEFVAATEAVEGSAAAERLRRAWRDFADRDG